MNDYIKTLVKELATHPTIEQIKQLKQAVQDLEKPQREKLLEEYGKKPIRRIYQIDGWANVPAYEECPRPDKNGYGLTGGWMDELRRFAIPVRVQILKGTSRREAIELIEKTLSWLRNSENLLNEEELEVPS